MVATQASCFKMPLFQVIRRQKIYVKLVPPMVRSKWFQEDFDRLMKYYKEMKAKCRKNNWQFISKRLGGRYTGKDCYTKVVNFLRTKKGEKYLEEDSQRTSTEQTGKFKIYSYYIFSNVNFFSFRWSVMCLKILNVFLFLGRIAKQFWLMD